MGYYGEDGQMYDTLDQLRGANNRYRQQQEQNRLLKERNDFMRKEKEDREREKRAKDDKERRDLILEGLKNYIGLFCFGTNFNDFDNFGMLKRYLASRAGMIEDRLKFDIDILIMQRDGISTNVNENELSDFDKFFDEGLTKIFKEHEEIFLFELNVLKNYIENRKNENIDFGIELFQNVYQNVLNYANSEFKKVCYDFKIDFNIENSKHWGGFIHSFKNYDKIILEDIEIEKSELLKFQQEQERKINRIKDDEENVDKKIKEVKNKINQLNKSTTLKNIDEVKNIITDVDYDFLKEIIGNNYSLEEIVLLIKGHIKQVELEVPRLENKKIYYKVLMYLTENVTYTDIFDYAEFDENTDYKKEYDRILKFENDKKEEDKKLEQQRKIQEEKNKKLEEERKIKEKKIQEDKRNEERTKKILPLYKKRNSYKKTMIGLNIFFALIGILFTVMSIMESPALLVTVGMLIVMAIFFNIIFKPEKQYLSQIKLLNLGFKSIEEFEKEAVKIIENNKNN